MNKAMQTHWAGIELSPVGQREVDLERELDRLKRLTAGEEIEDPHLSRPTPSALAVMVNDEGDEFVVLPTDNGPALTAWVSGSTGDIGKAESQGGGFVSKDALKQTAEQTPKRPPEDGPTREELLAAVLRAIGKSGLPTARSGNAEEPGQGGAEEAGQGGAEEPARPSLSDAIKDRLPQAKVEALVNVLAQGLFTGSVNVFSVLSGGLSSLGLAALQHLMGEGPDDEDSTAEWAMTIVGPRLGKELLAMGDYKKFLGLSGYTGPCESAALRVGDLDEKKNPILEGLPSVKIEGKMAARAGDKVDKAGKECVYGAVKVLIGGKGKFAAREDVPGGYGTRSCDAAAPFPKGSGASRTFIGGPTSNPAPPIPDAWKNLPAFQKDGKPNVWKPSEAGKPRTAHDIPTEPCFVFEENEWRMFHPETGFSASMSEFGGGSGSWQPDLEPNWWEENVLTIGSAEWPGAGNASTWWVPDTLFGIDMSGYFTRHDWCFNPGDSSYASAPWGFISDCEIPAFLAGLSSQPLNVGWPAALALQVLYSTATTTAAFATWASQLTVDLKA